METLSVLNVKGLTGTFALTPITIITGANSIGKTAILSAIKLALLGYDPSLGKRNIDTWNLSSGPQMAVVADGKTFRWEEKRAKVQPTFPDGFEAFPETMLDLGSLFAATREQRMLTIIRACVMPDHISTKALVDQVRTVAPKFPFPKSADSVLEQVELISGACKTYISTLNGQIAELEASGKRHADEMAAQPCEPNSLEPQISECSQRLGVAKEKLRAASNSDSERARLNARVSAMVIPDAAKLEADLATVLSEAAVLPEGDIAAVNAKYDPMIKKLQEELGSKRGQFKALKERLAAVDGKDECPTCGHAITSADVDKINADMDKLGESGQKVSAKLKALEAERDAERSQIIGATSKRNELLQKAAVLKQQIATIPELEASKALLLENIAKLPTSDQIEQFEEEVNGYQAALEALQQRQRYYVSGLSMQNAAAAAVKVRQQKEDELGQAKTAKSIIDGFRTTIIDEVSKTVLGVANRVVEPTTGHKLEMVDGDFRLGKACLTTLSGSERILVYAGLQIALSAAHNPKIVLMDELGVVDAARKERLFHVLEQLIGDGTISQFVGVDLTPIPSLPTIHGASLIKL